MNLATLPDDELLQVLRFLGNRDLLRCRGVCRRLRDAALHPHLWRERNVAPSSDGVELCAAVLRLAPCLGTLHVVVLNGSMEYLQLGTLLATTNCAVSKLKVLSSEFVSIFLAMLIARQATLGRLTSVSVSTGDIDTSEFQLVLDQLLHTQGLTSIAVEPSKSMNSVGLALPKAAKSDAVPASLRALRYRIHDDPRLLSYLQWHADTLQVVDLVRCTVPAGTLKLLGSLPRLRELRCDVMENMQALLHWPSLKTLHLCVRSYYVTPRGLSDVQQYLRQAVADRLEDLTLEYEEEVDVYPKYTASFVGGVNLVQCLAGPSSSTPSALRSLRLVYMFRHGLRTAEPQPQLQPLAAVLHRLENLESLNLGCPPTDDFLAALDGRVLPRLEQLRLFLSDYFCDCPHEWAHGPEPRDLLRKYPRLHLDLHVMHSRGCMECDEDDEDDDDDDYYGCEVCKCDYCAENTCHDFRSVELYTLFSHPEHGACNQVHEAEGFMRIDL